MAIKCEEGVTTINMSCYQRTVCKNDVGDCQKALTEADFSCRFIYNMRLGFNSRRDHSHNSCNENADKR